MIRDQEIDYKRKKVFLDESHFSHAADDQDKMVGTGDPVLTTVNSTNAFNGMDLASDADIIYVKAHRFWDMDVRHPLHITIVYTSDSTTTGDDIVNVISYGAIAVGEAIGSPATALDTTIAATTWGGGTAWIIKESSTGVINGGTFTEGDFISFKILGTTNDMTALHILGVSIEYTPKITRGAGRDFEATSQADSD